MADEKFIAGLRVFKVEDRKALAAILFDNGYTVRQGKAKRTESGKTVDYTVVVTDRCGESSGK